MQKNAGTWKRVEIVTLSSPLVESRGLYLDMFRRNAHRVLSVISPGGEFWFSRSMLQLPTTQALLRFINYFPFPTIRVEGYLFLL